MPRTRRAGFLPSTGTLHFLDLPQGEGVRVESGVRAGDAVTPFYDPMIAKLIAWGADRATARARLIRALADTALFGVATNLGFLARDRRRPGIRRRRGRYRLHRAADGTSGAARPGARAGARRGGIASPPRERGGGKAAGSVGPRRWLAAQPVPRRRASPSAAAPKNGRCRRARRRRLASSAPASACSSAAAERGEDGRLLVALDGVRRTLRVLEHGATLAVFVGGESWIVDEVDPLMPPAGATAIAGRLTAPMPGRVVQLLVAAGDRVRQGQPMMVVEAMKMEHTIAAPRDGTVESVRYLAGDLVEEGAELIALDPPRRGGPSDAGRDFGRCRRTAASFKMAVSIADIDELRRVRAARTGSTAAARSIPATSRAAPRRCWPAARSIG